MFENLDYTAIVAITLIAFFIGFLWYGPLFGKEWMKLVGLTEKDVKGPMAPPMIKGLVSSFVVITTAVYFISQTGASTWQEGALQGMLMSVGLVAAILFGQVNWEKRPARLFLINALYWVVILTVAGAVYAGWPA